MNKVVEPTPEGEKLKAVKLAEDEIAYFVEAIYASSNQESLSFYKRLLKKLLNEKEYKEYLRRPRFEKNEEKKETVDVHIRLTALCRIPRDIVESIDDYGKVAIADDNWFFIGRSKVVGVKKQIHFSAKKDVEIINYINDKKGDYCILADLKDKIVNE